MSDAEITQSPAMEMPVGKPPSELTWLFAGMVLPCFSAKFYLEAAKRSVSRAILFMILFGLVSATMATVGLMRTFFSFTDAIQKAYAEKKIPEITIMYGVASVEGPQPNVLYAEDGMAAIIDTRQKEPFHDLSFYGSGFTLTRTTLEIVDRSGRANAIPLSEINAMFKMNVLHINADSVSNLWNGFSTITGILFWIGAFIWEALIRLGYLALLALVVTGIYRLFQPRAAYSPIFVVGVYAFIPALYLNTLLGSIHVRFIFLQTLIWLAIWAVALGLAVRAGKRVDNVQPIALMGWRTWLGVPFVAVLALNVIFSWSEQQAWVLWVIGVGTLMALIVVELVRTLKAAPSAAS